MIGRTGARAKQRGHFLLWILAALPASVHAQLVPHTELTPEQVVQQLLFTSEVTVSNVIYTGDPAQIGWFEGSACNLGIDTGMVMATGDIHLGIGPNDDPGASMGPVNNSTPDADFESISGNPFVYDKAQLDFDVVSTSDSLRFTLVFASEEYLSTITFFNEPVAIFLSGPGIQGPYDGGAENIAMVPGTQDAIGSMTINPDVNSAWYIDNGDGESGPQFSLPYYMQYNGFTFPIPVRAAVQPGTTYHVRLAIADVSDWVWDSAVFFVKYGDVPDIGEGLSVDEHVDPGSLLAFWNGSAIEWSLPEGVDGTMDLRVFTGDGRLMLDRRVVSGDGPVRWSPPSSGCYVVRSTGNGTSGVARVVVP